MKSYRVSKDKEFVAFRTGWFPSLHLSYRLLSHGDNDSVTIETIDKGVVTRTVTLTPQALKNQKYLPRRWSVNGRRVASLHDAYEEGKEDLRSGKHVYIHITCYVGAVCIIERFHDATLLKR